ncbi:hypothetical protein EVB32_177 [Rhizobium phage RHph_TM39]|uniref:Uncharacterized protein n=1 Tax=Rhizobium phage RHph_TM30 TaxID=2509764 RepID=A0A7S5R568_9CAUD|nr:hypothetical protein PQC16_gp178 [Rhizobium phage RHph_TM30]QIG71285.1 hypothetical protein EVB93_178 [Rhizobium phage RHph_TM30]QIG72011.1 hypothetical protein EVB95_177 [Rhizobium phage RHph_TM2_3B]QIG72374.1 hypothetical protein EVB96_178 [Rhizobium phage RHph_TM3_3_6]QIG77165.1 hypothetical protein EVB32_177 [Rhizobium phage RHph_TM39]
MSIEYFIKLGINLTLSLSCIGMLIIMRQILHKESFTQKRLIMLFTSILIVVILAMIWTDYSFVVYRYLHPAVKSDLILNGN